MLDVRPTIKTIHFEEFKFNKFSFSLASDENFEYNISWNISLMKRELDGSLHISILDNRCLKIKVNVSTML